MEEERLHSSRENPRFPPGDRPPRLAAAAEQQPLPASRPPPSILDRFRAMLREREEELREATGEDPPPSPPPPHTAGEIVRLYKELLSELTFNSKPIITDLSIIAGQHSQFAEGIANAICARILEVPVDQKLPSLYLLDSIVKNIGRDYVRYFAARLPKMCAADGHDKVHTTDFDGERMEGRASEGSKGWQGASPKFHDIEHVRGVSSSLQVYGKKSSMQCSEYNIDHPEVLPARPGVARTGSPQTAATCTASMVEVEGPTRQLKIKISRPSPPPIIGPRKSISPPVDRFSRDTSPRRMRERASPSHSGFVYGPGRGTSQNGWLERRRPFDDGAQQIQASMAFNLNNGYAKQRSRELIDAYGNYTGKSFSLEKLPKVPRLDVNSVASERASRKWKNSEEEEYVWEDMSPTLSDRSRRNSLPPFGPSTGSLSTRAGLTRPDASLLDHDSGRRSWPGQAQLPAVGDPANTIEDRIPVFGPAHGSMNRKYLDSTVSQNDWLPPYQGSHHTHEPRKLPYMFPKSSQHNLSPRSRRRAHQMPVAASGITSLVSNKLPSPYEHTTDMEVPFSRLSSSHSDPFDVDTSTLERHLAQRPHSPPPPPIVRPSVHNNQQLPLLPIPPNQKQLKSPFDDVEAHKPIPNQRPESFLYLSQYQNDTADRKTLNSNKLLQVPYQQPGLAHSNQQSQEQGTTMQIQSQKSNGSIILPASAQLSSQMVAQPLNHVPNHLSGLPSVGVNSMPDTSLHVNASVLPPLPPGPPPASSQMGPVLQNTGSMISSSPAGAFSGLISTLMAQGLISLTPPAQSQDSVGVEFNAELLKVRHESVINALYTDLPRQCTTCGLRFKCQEEHSSHMDWHVTKNRMSKNRKQKPSRKWFVSAKEWLSGAETLGNDVVPGFLPTETVTEKREDKEMAVPADENQNVCALCGEPFEDFYSDEAEEWMYRGAVYLYARDGYTEGLDRSQLGPIVHAKCRSESKEGSGQA
ncbi:polyadenylation and cleavage factor homolog 4-like isoform X2 [Phoenix dactylifera]|uniref:Polyadenylation and cleavage factor homolog 4-like isoform X2 n=1 Tax=Phoenix dactylifera TaxID=42345 RepID=A0A8B7CY15_PHODC|nr:polyadenylation and cleavage factor homolog 4-like isoform X2 [Phoenix dactylifera]